MNQKHDDKKKVSFGNVEKFISRVKKDGELMYLVEVSVRNKPGKKPVRPKMRGYAQNLTRARLLRSELQQLLHKEVFGAPTLAEFFPKYLVQIKRHKQPATAENERLAFEGHILPQLRHLKMTDVTPEDLNAFLFEYLKDKAPSTKRNYRKFLRGIFKAAVQQRIISVDPTEELRPIKLIESSKAFLTGPQIEHFLRFVLENMHEWRHHYVVAVLTGMRVGELRAFRWTHIDWDRALIHVVQSMDNKGRLGPTKTRTARWIPLLPQLREHLEDLKKETNPSEDDFVLDNLPKWRSGEQGKPLKFVLELLGLPEMRFYDFRASFACFMAEQLPLHQVSEILGHASIEMTAKYLRKYGVTIGKVIDQVTYVPMPSLKKKD